MTNLIPDPPLGDFPALPENMRWRIAPQDKWALDHGYKDLRHVVIEEKIVLTERILFWKHDYVRWTKLARSVWDVRKGLGDLSLAGKRPAYELHGLANAMAHALDGLAQEMRYRQDSPDQYIDLHGVSKW